MWNKDLVEFLINRYKEHENLYDAQHPMYMNRVKRSNSLFAICQEIKKKIKKDVSEEEVKKKIHNLRSQYIRELRKIANSKQSGVGEDDVLRPKFWCFSLLKFLRPHCQIRKSGSNILNLNEESAPNSPSQHSSTQLSSEDDESSDESETLGGPNKRWTKDSILLLISNYKLHKGLYDSKHNLYHKKKYRNWALNDIAEKLQCYFSDITIADIKAKIHYLRAHFCREEQKVYDSTKTATCDEDIYKPSTYWFKEFEFIKDHIRPRRDKISLEVASEDRLASGISEASEQLFDESSMWEIEEVQIPNKQRKLQQPSYNVLELTEIAQVNKPEEDSYNDNLLIFLRENIKMVTDPDLKDDMTQKIITVVLEYKKKQRNLRK